MVSPETPPYQDKLAESGPAIPEEFAGFQTFWKGIADQIDENAQGSGVHTILVTPDDVTTALNIDGLHDRLQASGPEQDVQGWKKTAHKDKSGLKVVYTRWNGSTDAAIYTYAKAGYIVSAAMTLNLGSDFYSLQYNHDARGSRGFGRAIIKGRNMINVTSGRVR